MDYENCKCRKKLVDKLVEKCNESINKTRLVEKTLAENKHENECSSCTLYIVLFSLSFAINNGIGTYFVYFKYISHNKENILNMITTIKQKIINICINGTSQRSKH